MPQTATLPQPLPAPPSGETLERRIAAEFLEMPGLSLTQSQARRLFNIPEPACSHTLDALVERGLLQRAPDGRYRCTVVRA